MLQVLTRFWPVSLGLLLVLGGAETLHAQAVVEEGSLRRGFPAEWPAESREDLPPGRFDVSELNIELKRLGCVSECPMYTVLISGEGGVGYSGTGNVAVLEARNRFVGSEAVLDLLDHFFKAGFFDLRGEYHREKSGMSLKADGMVDRYSIVAYDVPAHVLTVRIGEYEKQVYWRGKSNPTLDGLAELIDGAVGAQEWVEGR